MPNTLPVLKINSSNTGLLSCNLSPGNLYLIQESQFFSDTICAISGGTVLISSMCVKTAFAKKVFMLALTLISHTPFHIDVTVFSTVALHTRPSPRDSMRKRRKYELLFLEPMHTNLALLYFLYILIVGIAVLSLLSKHQLPTLLGARRDLSFTLFTIPPPSQYTGNLGKICLCGI